MVACHQLAFPGQNMTLMGTAWLRALYKHYLDDPRGVSYVAVADNGEVTGLAVGGDDSIRPAFLRAACRRFFPLLCWRFLSCRGIRKAVLSAIGAKCSPHRGNEDDTPQPTPPPGSGGVLLSIGVRSETRGTGTANKLICQFTEALLQNYDYARLSVRCENRRARRFYERNGWQLLSQGKTSVTYVKQP